MERPVTGADQPDRPDDPDRPDREQSSGAVGASSVLRAGGPGIALAVLAPIAAVSLVAFRVATEGLAAGAEDPVPPVVLAVATIVGGLVLAWRAATQRAELGPDGIRCRNLVVGFDVDWNLVQSVAVIRRGPVQLVELHLTHLRRHHRVGAATRWNGSGADDVQSLIASHPRAAERLVVDDPAGTTS